MGELEVGGGYGKRLFVWSVTSARGYDTDVGCAVCKRDG